MLGDRLLDGKNLRSTQTARFVFAKPSQERDSVSLIQKLNRLFDLFQRELQIARDRLQIISHGEMSFQNSA